jgi:protein SCO1/2
MPRLALVLLILPAFLLSGCAHRYRVQGMVLDVNHSDRTVIVSHRAIPGYMDAMAMPFHVRTASELNSVKRGDQIEFQLVVKRRTSLAEKVKARTIAEVANARRGEAPLPLPIPAEKLELGMPVPDFQLINQAARHIRLSDFAGRILAVNFIYTRCPLPEVCPRLSANFAHLQKRFHQQMGKDLVLLSVTLDSQHDTAIVLADYAKRWGAGEGWQFLTGDPAEIQRLASQFGLVYWPEEGLLTHTSQTGIIGRDGRLAALIEGSSYEEDQLGDLVARQLEVSHDSHRQALGFANERGAR